MGHSDVQTTMNIYNEIQEAKKKEAFTELNNKIMISWQLNQSTKKGRFEHRPFAVSLKPIWSELNSVFQRFLKAEILRYTVTFVSPAASLSGNYDLNGQRSASPCWPSAVAQQRLNRPRLKVCDSLLFTILSLAHALAYVAYSAQYRLHLRLVRTGLPFTRSLYHCIGALQLEISTEPFAQYCKRRFPNASACFYQSLWGFYVFNFILQFTVSLSNE